MNSTSDHPSQVFWIRGVSNGFLALTLGMLAYMIPALVVAFQMGIDLGPKLHDSSAVSSQISARIAALYSSNVFLAAGFGVILAALVYWRARVIARTSVNSSSMTGALVGGVPAIAAIVTLFLGRGGLSSIAAMILFLAAGIFGAMKRKDLGTAPPTSAPNPH